MSQKFLAIVGNDHKEVTTVTTSAGSADAGKAVALDAAGKLDPTLTYESQQSMYEATESISAGALVNIYLSGGVSKVRNADASSEAKRAHGFAFAAIASSATGPVVEGVGLNASVSGLTSGTNYFLSDSTPGGLTATAPTTATHIYQPVGVAKSATELVFLAGDVIVRA